MMTDRNKIFLAAMDALIAEYEQEGGVTIGLSLRISNHIADDVDHYRWNGEMEFQGTTDSFEDIGPNKNSLTNGEADTTKIQVVYKDGFSDGGAGELGVRLIKDEDTRHD